MGERSPAVVWRLAESALVARDVDTLERLLRDHRQMFLEQKPQSTWLGNLTPDYSAGDVRAIVVRNHLFESWEQFCAFRDAMADGRSAIARFEAAADAIVGGDIATLERLLQEEPVLVRARSTRSHNSTLLHYVGANGVESWRQRTPKNIVAIARLLLAAGADVNAHADMYGGGATTLGLAATSIHPWQAGVLEPLLDALLDAGASFYEQGAGSNSSTLVVGCLADGRPLGAELLARRGASLDLEGAAGVGRLDLVRSYFAADGSLKPPATSTQMKDGFTWACEFGRADVVNFLLERGMDVAARVRHHGQTGLHWAAGGGHAQTVAVLLAHGAQVNAEDETWKFTPLAWALFGWRNNDHPETTPTNYYEVVRRLVAAGGTAPQKWLEDEGVRADARMVAALRGE
jgi:hypothetical protein